MEQVVVFRLGNEEYALSLTTVKEIVGSNWAINTPDALECFTEIIHLRGKEIPVVDLAKRFGLVSADGRSTQTLIIDVADMKIGIAVTEVKEVLQIEQGAVEPFQSDSHHAGQFIRGVVRRDDQLLRIIDPEKVFSMAENEKLAAAANQSGSRRAP
ncbi:MAG: chemotaxis protein CheW [Negativicutes bacterium]|nr:chemotaxis protein CheW [Negativicutes bacterium]